MKLKLTQRKLPTLVLPAGKAEVIHFDEDLPGFGLRLRGNAKTFVVQYKIGPQHRRMTIGSTAQLSLEQARNEARKIQAKVRLGEDPASEKQEAVAALADRFEARMRDYLTQQKSKLRPSSYHRTEAHFLDHWKPLHTLPITRIDRQTVVARLDNLVADRGPAAADRARAVLSAFFTWAMKKGIVEANPVAVTERPYNPKTKARKRVLSESELIQVWHAAGAGSYGTIVKLLILTGARREEIGQLRWSEVDFAGRVIRLPAERVKNGEAHDLPLSDPAIALLRAMPVLAGRDPIFGSGAKGLGAYSILKQQLDARVAAGNDQPLVPWVIHDLRRSAATHMAELGIQPHIIEAILNHVSGHKAGVAGTYNRASYDREKRQALDRWAAHLMALVEGRASNVVAMAR